jgi:hypothetical protein
VGSRGENLVHFWISGGAIGVTSTLGVAHGESAHIVVAWEVGWPMGSGRGAAQGQCFGGTIRKMLISDAKKCHLWLLRKPFIIN